MNPGNENCCIKVNSELVKAEFIGVFQYSHVLDPSPMIGGHQGGVVAYPLAVVKHNGKLKEVKLSEITFES
ncbi:hypothetical protein FZD47_25460 [Bacillus infantis]|uniref:Uncharacterized protein n=1 Tax=Bacillus infantis TaxID=324767 RepID=A0A5D4RWV9_9BACI|nr:hypothetical protein FZD47_25460 [Bacillus infantis]